MAEALATFAIRTGLEMIYLSDDVIGLKSKGSPAGVNAAAALSHLIEGTGLRFEFLDDRTVRLFKASDLPLTSRHKSRAPDVTPALSSESI